jgi:hypothetical protein
MNGAGTIVALAVLTLLCSPAAARGGLGTYTCIDRAGSLASDGSACRNWVNPYESAASAAERRNAAWLKRYPDEAAYEAERQVVLERMRARTPAHEQDAAAARVNRRFDAQMKSLRPLWRQPEHP